MDNSVGRVVEIDRGGVERLRLAPDVNDVAQHLRRLAQQHGEVHVHRHVAVDRILDGETPVFGCASEHRERAALSIAQGLERGERFGTDGEHVALLRLVAPDLAWRHARLLRRNRA